MSTNSDLENETSILSESSENLTDYSSETSSFKVNFKLINRKPSILDIQILLDQKVSI